jgi:small-conductance mechanosensitive channel
MNNVQKAILAIRSIESTDDLNQLIDAFKLQRTYLARQAARSLTVGDNVNFTNSRTGRNTTGVVMKIAIKFVTVKTIDGLWRVPASALTQIA